MGIGEVQKVPDQTLKSPTYHEQGWGQAQLETDLSHILWPCNTQVVVIRLELTCPPMFSSAWPTEAGSSYLCAQTAASLQPVVPSLPELGFSPGWETLEIKGVPQGRHGDGGVHTGLAGQEPKGGSSVYLCSSLRDQQSAVATDVDLVRGLEP